MATIKKVTRGRRNPPSLGAPVQDWLAYVATTSDDDVLLEDGEPSSRTAGKQSSSSKRVSFAPKVRYENESEVVFGLPRLSLHLITEHDQPMTARIAKILALNRPPSRDPWLSTVPSPHVVDCTFESRFGGSLCVTMDVSALLFLHELIQAYMKEKDAVVSSKLIT